MKQSIRNMMAIYSDPLSASLSALKGEGPEEERSEIDDRCLEDEFQCRKGCDGQHRKTSVVDLLELEFALLLRADVRCLVEAEGIKAEITSNPVLGQELRPTLAGDVLGLEGR